MIRVLGDRVLVKPDVIRNAPEQLASGIYTALSMQAALTGEDAVNSLCRGTVVQVGHPRHPLKDEAEALAHRLLLSRLHEDDEHHPFTDAANMLRDLTRRQPCVSVGDDVLFAHDVGQELTVESETYVMLREADLLGVVEEEGAYV